MSAATGRRRWPPRSIGALASWKASSHWAKPVGCCAAMAAMGARAASAALAVAALAGQRRQAQQHERGHGAAGRQGVVLQAARSCHERLRVVGRVVEAAVLGAGSAPGPGPPARARPRRSAPRTWPRRAPAGRRRGGCGPRARPRAGHGRPSRSAAVDRPGVRSSRSRKSAASVAHLEEGRLVQGPAGIGEGGERQPVPGGQHLVVAGRLWPSRRGAAAARRAPRVSASRTSSRGRSNSTASEVSSRTRRRMVRPSQLPARGDVVGGLEERGDRSPRTSRISSPARCRWPLLAVRVRVEAGGEGATGRIAQLVGHEVERLADHVGVALVARHLPGVACRRAPAGRCRRASSRSAARATAASVA